MVEQSMQVSLSRIANYDRQQRGERRPDDPPRSPPLHGDVLDSPDERAFILQAYALRKRSLPVDEIAMLTGRTEEQVRRAVATRLKELDADEMSEMSQAKRMMLEQIDAMMAAISTPATGKEIDGSNAPVVLEAIDRMVKLMDQKSKLLGLSAPQKIDLTSRIEILARTSGYDLDELRAITAEVLSEYSPQRLRGV